MIDYTIRGGSGTGLSYYSKLLKCPNQAYLDRQEAQEAGAISGNRGVGTLYHAFMDLYFGGNYELQPSEVHFLRKDGQPQAIDEVCRVEAERVFGWYKDSFGALSFGEVISTEQVVKDLTADVVEGSDKTPFTVGLDLLVEVDDAARHLIKEQRGVDLSQNGVYVVDFKTEKALTMGLTDRFIHSIQMSAYQIVAKEVLGYDVKGALVDVVIKTKTPRNIVVPVEYPSSLERKVLRSYWEAVERRLETPREVNLEACFFPSICHHFITGACMRYSNG